MTRITLCATIAAALAVAGAVAQTPSVAIIHVTVIDGRGNPPRPNSTVIVTDEIITAVHTRPPPRAVAIIDGHNGYVVPASSTCMRI